MLLSLNDTHSLYSHIEYKQIQLTHRTVFTLTELAFVSSLSSLHCLVELLMIDAMEEKYDEHHELLDMVT